KREAKRRMRQQAQQQQEDVQQMAASWVHSDLMIIVSNACTEEPFGSPPTWAADTSCHDAPRAQ
ncbi:hypothetical protein, partial [Pseudomonas carnis]|uniref:hypothetical protein n=1 Tax=Pseudomonas carnis TaxID=2487355 RepID=UPI001F212E97